MELVGGFPSFFRQVKNKGLRTVLVSSTSTYTLEWIDKYFNITHLFDLLVTKKDTANHKPHPEPYIKALQALPASTGSTIVIEDSPNGIVSAKKAGCKVYALATSFSIEKLSEADGVFKGYTELSAQLGFPVE
jgi:beta-phosphoglucomutase-like phosphatase (HAD superfamily)